VNIFAALIISTLMKKYLILALLPFAFTACKKDKDKDGQVLMPLTIGNQWVYEHVVFDDNEVEADRYAYPPIVILKKGTRDGYFSAQEDDSEQYYSSATEIRGYSPDEKDEYQFLKSDKQVSYRTVTDDNNGVKTESIAYPETSKVLNFDNCIRNEYILTDANGVVYGKDIYYVSPGVGIVRESYYQSNGSGGWKLRYSDDLKSYTIK
jgi:hypothetical protein